MEADLMPDVPGTGLLTRKLGPLPGWGWALLAGGAMGIFLYLRNRNAQPQVSTGTDTATGDVQAPLQTTGFGTLVPAPTTVVPGTPPTNEEWVQSALAAMAIADPFLDAAAAEAALMQYISGGSLSPSQAAYVSLARALIGAPPIAIPPKNTAPPPRPKPLPSPITTIWQGHKLTSNTTWISLARQYSASQSPNGIESTKRALFLHNPTIVARIGTHDNAILQRGWIVLIPVRKQAAA